MNTPSIKLDPPGAGLPFPEGFLARFVAMPLFSRLSSWEESLTRFEREGQRIIRAVEAAPSNVLETPVLVPRIQGLEDSSRFWSIAMALEHLVFTGEKIRFAALELSHERVPPGYVNIADLKPKGKLSGAQELLSFKKFLNETPLMIQKGVGSRKAKARLNHPWFGGLQTFQWIWLLGAHQAIHRKQIQEILKRSHP